jgi:acyl-CoA synthetase (AMP-forming)/AMP-acid ligase II
MMAGVVFTVIPPPIDEGKLLRFVSVLKSCRPKFLISNYGLEQEADSGVKKTVAKKAFFEAVSLKRIYTDRVQKHNKGLTFTTPEDDDIIYLQYTSGSTSEPKGVMVSSGNLMSCLNSSRDAYDYSSGNNLVSWVPFYHNIGLVSGIFLPITADQGEVYFVPPLQFLKDPKIWIKVLSGFKANATAGPNSAYEACTRIFRKEDAAAYDLSHVNMLLNGSEFVHFCDLFGLETDSFSNGYGLSECVCVGTVSVKRFKYQRIDMDAYQEGKFIPTESDTSKPIVSLGRPISGLKVLAVREDGSPCSENEIGEIYIQGNSVCKGYFENPKESERFKAIVQGHDGFFFRTEDMGAIFGGELYLTGRLKEMIIVNGKKSFYIRGSYLRLFCSDKHG